MSKFERYDRQIRVPGFGLAAQHHLNTASVLLVGAGGLGFAVASLLAGAGVGEIKVVDFDEVSLTNLHRQWLYIEKNLGQSKSKVLANHLKALNSDIQIEHVHHRLSPDNAKELAAGATLIIDAADNFPTSYLLSDIAENQKIPLISASVNQRYGYVGAFSAKGSPSFRTVFPRASNAPTSCDLVGVSGPAVTVVAGLQAQAVIDSLCGNDADLAGKVLYVDLRNHSFNLLDCGHLQRPTTLEMQLLSSTLIHAEDWVIDVRELNEIEESPQPFQVDQVCPLSAFDVAEIETIKHPRIVLSCKTGQRAMIAAQQLIDAGEQAIAIVLPSSE